MKGITLRQNERIYFGWWVLLFCFVLMAIGYAGILSIGSIFVVPITEDLGFTRSSFMIYTTVMMASSVVFTKFYSVGMGRGGRTMQWIIAVNAVAVFLAYFGFSRATALWHFYGCAVLLGSGFASLSTLPVSILMTNWFGGSIKGAVMALAFTGSGVGGMCLAPFINFIIEQYSWRQGYVVLGLFFLVLLLPLSFLLARASPEEFGFVKMGRTREESASREGRGLTYEEAKRRPYFWTILVGLFVIVLGSGALISNIAAYYVECGFSQSQAAAFTGYMSGSLIIGKLACGFLCDKKGAKAGTVLCFSLFILCFLQLFLLRQHPILVYGIIATYGFGCGAITTAPPLLVTRFFGERDYSAILGIVTMAINLSVAVAGLFAARVFDMTQSYSWYWLISVFGSAITTCLVLLAFRQKKAEESVTVTAF